MQQKKYTYYSRYKTKERMISFDTLLEHTNPCIHSFRILQDTKCKRQIDDLVLGTRFVEETGIVAKKGEVYDGEIVVKSDQNLYLFLGYDASLGYEVYIPLSWNGSLETGRITNITEA